MTINYEKKWGIDSNLLLYFFDGSSVFHQKTIGLFKELLDNHVSIYITQNNIIEVHRVMISFHHIPKVKALNDIFEVVNSFNIHIVTSSPFTMNTYFNLCKLSKKDDVFDLYFASILIDNNIHSLLTNNTKDFIGLEKEIQVHCPF